ncbi:MAG: DUF4292 domain-containing protein, partial [Deltaproteobacteria bacterium]|nr:DUF4292 domain-containing protein [Deltaproteobacteria bacterium]
SLKKTSPLPSHSLLAVLEKQRDGFKSLKGIARVEVIPQDGNGIKGRAVVMAKGSNFRLEFLSPFHQPVAILTYNRGGLTFFSPDGFYSGEGYLPFEPSALYLFGWPIVASPMGSYLSYNETKGLYILELDHMDGTHQRLWIDPSGYHILKSEIYGRDRILTTTMVMGNFQEVNGGSFPFNISISHHLGSVHIEYEKVELNQEIDNGVFLLD